MLRCHAQLFSDVIKIIVSSTGKPQEVNNTRLSQKLPGVWPIVFNWDAASKMSGIQFFTFFLYSPPNRSTAPKNLTNCFQEKCVAASKVSGAPIFRARSRASTPDRVVGRISGDWKQIIFVWFYWPSRDGWQCSRLDSYFLKSWSGNHLAPPNLLACFWLEPVYRCVNQPTIEMQCISPEKESCTEL